MPDVTVAAGNAYYDVIVNSLPVHTCFFFDVFDFNQEGAYNYGQSNNATTFDIVGDGYQNAINIGNGSYTAETAAYPYQWPDYVSGKLYFIDNTNSLSYCSASLVVSPDANIVVTAGHCVNSGGTGPGGSPGTFFTDYFFYPSYFYGPDMDYVYEGTGVVTTGDWYNNSDLHDDFAVVAVTPVYSGVPAAGSAFGQSGILFDQLPTQSNTYRLRGYPSNINNGMQIQRCVGGIAETTNSGPFNAFLDGSEMVVGCNMGTGSSGGPWYVPGDPNTLLRSVVSFSWPPGIAGPSLLWEAQDAWHLAIAAFSS